MEYLRVVLIALTLIAFRHGNDGFNTYFPVPAGVTSSPFAPVIINLGSGHFNGAQTVAISDGSQGGTLTPSVGSPGTSMVTVTPAKGGNNFTLTYAAASTGNKTISFTNGQAWSNPSSQVYFVNTAANRFGDTWNNPGGAPACTGCTHSSYHSNIMNQDIGFNIYLPPQYVSQPSTHFPVVYFFHGNPGNENGAPPIVAPLVESKINAATVKPMIFVFPKTGAHEMDSIPGAPAYGAYMAESTIIYELIPFIDANYRTIATKAGRAFQGFSMGGQGCERLAFKFPQMISSIYCFAPAIDDTGANIGSNEPATLSNMFNGDTNAFNTETVWSLSVSNLAAIKTQALPIHVTIGDQDSLFRDNVRFLAQLDSLGIAHDPLTTATGCGHDLTCDITFVGGADIDYASAHFPRS